MGSHTPGLRWVLPFAGKVGELLVQVNPELSLGLCLGFGR